MFIYSILCIPSNICQTHTLTNEVAYSLDFHFTCVPLDQPEVLGGYYQTIILYRNYLVMCTD